MIRRLFILLWFPAMAFAQQAYYGTTVSSVRISDEGAADLERIPLRTGDTITPQNVRNAIQVLFETGRYKTIEVDATPAGNGTQLTFNVTPYYFFSTFRLVPENLLGRPLSSLLRLPVGQKYSEVQVEAIAEEARQMLKDAGYFEVTLTVVPGPDNPRHLRTVDLRAEAKERARIMAVNIEGGAGILSEAEIRDSLDVSVDDEYSADEINTGRGEIREKFIEKNYPSVQVTADPQYDAATNTVRLNVKVDPGQPALVDAGTSISQDDIRKLLPVFEEGSLDPELIEEGRTRIVEHFQQKGYFEAVVEQPKVIPSTGSDPVRINFSIEPGERHRVRSITFQGNTYFSDAQLRERIRVRPASFPAILSHGTFTDQLLKTDVETIRTMYRRAGFEAAFIEGHRTDSSNHEIDVVFDITENERYPVETLVFAGNVEIPEAELRNAVRLQEKSTYSPAQASDDRLALMTLYYSMGFPDVRIEATADRNPLTSGRKLTYQIAEGRRYRVGELLVAGNTRTAEKVVKRASGLKEYSWFNPEHVLEAQQKLYATGLFSHVDVVPLDRDSGELRAILIQVEEGQAVLVSFGPGVKEYAGPRATLDISHNNLLGLNRSLSIRLRVGVHEQQFQTTYREPRLFNHDDLDGFGTLTAERSNLLYFEAARLELGIQARKRISPSRSLLTTLSYQTVNLQDIKLNPIVRRFKDVKGIFHIARIGGSFVSDTRDDALDPKTGVFSTSTLQVAGRHWGSEVEFVSLFQQTSGYRKAGIGTLALSSRIGFKNPYGRDNELPITERYFAGGSTTLRGFGLDEAGPPGGGQLLTLANVEYRVPIKSFSVGTLGVAAFYDGGNVFERPSDLSLRKFTHTAGGGLRFLTPLGPIRLDIGFNLHPRIRTLASGELEREKRMKAFITLGHAF